MDNEIKKEFLQMLRAERNSDTGWAVIMSMVEMLEEDDKLEHMAEIHKGISEYGQFLTEDEARRIVDDFRNFDGSRGGKWRPEVLFGAVESLGGKKYEKGKYNCWALYAVMNMQHSDYGGALMTVAQGDEYARLCYLMALAWFADPDHRHDVREYFDD